MYSHQKEHKWKKVFFQKHWDWWLKNPFPQGEKNFNDGIKNLNSRKCKEIWIKEIVGWERGKIAVQHPWVRREEGVQYCWRHRAWVEGLQKFDDPIPKDGNVRWGTTMEIEFPGRKGSPVLSHHLLEGTPWEIVLGHHQNQTLPGEVSQQGRVSQLNDH